MKDLTISNIERQNVLNNRFAVSKVQKHLDIEGILFEGEYRFTKKMVADFYEVEERTIERYLEKYSDELSANGYVLCKGKHLKELKLQFAPVINVGSKTTQLGLFNFRSFLNMGMLLTESEQAKKVRSLILDFVIVTINEKTGGGTKYINRRDINYLPAAITEEVKLLEHHTHAQEHLVGAPGVGADQIHIVVEDLSPCGLFQQVQAAQKGGLAAAGGAHNGHHLAGLDLDVDALEHLVLAKALLKPFDADHTHTVSAPRK